MSSLLSVSEATQRLLDFFSPLPVERLPLASAVGRVLAEPVIARYPVPPFPNSSMDGFALRTEDATGASHENPVDLRVVGDIPAGKNSDVIIQVGEAARIMTGAALPPGADTVVPVENTDFNYRQPGAPVPERVLIFEAPEDGQYIRPIGQDVRPGEVVMQPGQILRAQEIGLLAMLGEAEIPVHRRPRVALFSTGDELVPVDVPLTPGKIHDSNSYILEASIQKYGGNFLNLGIIPDRLEAVEACLERAADEGVDLILSSAGVSVGAFDFVRTVVETHGRLEFWRVNMRPGKPLAFGNYQGIAFIGLPGNPVSAFVGFEVFVRPALNKLGGLAETRRHVQRARLAEPVDSDGRESYLRAIVWEDSGERRARLTGHQGSGNLRSLVQANALLLIPSGVKFLPAGAEVETWMLT